MTAKRKGGKKQRYGEDMKRVLPEGSKQFQKYKVEMKTENSISSLFLLPYSS